MMKIPYLLVVGDKERQAAGAVAVRHRHEGDLGAQPVEAARGATAGERTSRGVRRALPFPAALRRTAGTEPDVEWLPSGSPLQ